MPIDPNKAMDLLKRLQLNQEYQLKSGTPEQFDLVDAQIERVGRVLEGGNKAQNIGMPAQPQEAGGPPMPPDGLDAQAARLQRKPGDLPVPGMKSFAPPGSPSLYDESMDGMDAIVRASEQTPMEDLPGGARTSTAVKVPWGNYYIEPEVDMPKAAPTVESMPVDPLSPEGDPESKALQMQLDQLGIEPRLAQRVYQGRKFNNPEDVERLQTFLNDHEDANIPVTGYFGELTKAAVERFQEKYYSDILAPWDSIPGYQYASLGNVYKTTTWKINSLVCGNISYPPIVLP